MEGKEKEMEQLSETEKSGIKTYDNLINEFISSDKSRDKLIILCCAVWKGGYQANSEDLRNGVFAK